MRKTNCEFNSSFVSEPGTFITNKSYFGFVELDDMACWIAADGLDSDEEKESAKLAVHKIFEAFMEKPTLSRFKLNQYIQNAHHILESESRNVRLKASLLMVVTDYSKIVWVVAGNTRLYHFRRGIFNFRSKDQTLAQLMADSEKITEDEIDQHEEHNNLVNYLGKSSGFKPFISRKFHLADGDIVLLCNSGFWENMSHEEIAEALPDSKTAEELVDNLEDMLLSKQNEVLNNYTIAAIYANRIFKETTTDYRALAKKVAMVVLPLVLTLGIGLLINHQINKARNIAAEKIRNAMAVKQKKTIAQHEQAGDLLVSGEKFQAAIDEYKQALEKFVDYEDPKKQADIKRKNEICTFIVDGDSFFTSEEYKKALEQYLNAKQKADGTAFNQNGIASRIAKVKKTIEMNDLIKQGDIENSSQNFADAKEKFQLAKSLAEQLNDQTTIGILEAKLANCQEKNEVRKTEDRTEFDRAQNIYQAKKLEKAGDEKYNLKQYKEALENYKLAKRSYEGLSMTQELLVVNEKITMTEKKAKKKFLFFSGGGN